MASYSLPFIRQKCPTECAKCINSVAQCKVCAFIPSNECAVNPGYMLENC